MGRHVNHKSNTHMTNAADHTDISQMSLDERFSIASKTDTAKELLSRLARPGAPRCARPCGPPCSAS